MSYAESFERDDVLVLGSVPPTPEVVMTPVPEEEEKKAPVEEEVKEGWFRHSDGDVSRLPQAPMTVAQYMDLPTPVLSPLGSSCAVSDFLPVVVRSGPIHSPCYHGDDEMVYGPTSVRRDPVQPEAEPVAPFAPSVPAPSAPVQENQFQMLCRLYRERVDERFRASMRLPFRRMEDSEE